MVIIIIGLPRSGTTLLGEIFAKAPSVHFESEPNPVWRYRNYARLGHDQFDPEHATDAVRRHVRQWFDRRKRISGRRILVEKTPANVLRIDFVRRIFPEAHIVFLRRKRAAVGRSMLARVVHGEDANIANLDDARLFRKFRIKAGKMLQIPPLDMPAYAPQVLSDLSGGAAFPIEQFWGPRPPNWRDLMQRPVEERLTLQCEAMVVRLRPHVEREDEGSTIVGYEDLVADPNGTLGRIEARLGFALGALDRSVIAVKRQARA